MKEGCDSRFIERGEHHGFRHRHPGHRRKDDRRLSARRCRLHSRRCSRTGSRRLRAGIERNMREPGRYCLGERQPRRAAAASSTTTATGSASPNSPASCATHPPRELAAELMQLDHGAVLPRPRAGQGTGHAEADALAPGHRPTTSSTATDRELLDSDRSGEGGDAALHRRLAPLGQDGAAGALARRQQFLCRRAATICRCPIPTTIPECKVLEWQMEPGDAVAFDFRTVHGARGNLTAAPPPRLLPALGRRRRPLRRAAGSHLAALSGPRHEARSAAARGLVPGRLPGLSELPENRRRCPPPIFGRGNVPVRNSDQSTLMP